jgi:hypothetical protein
MDGVPCIKVTLGHVTEDWEIKRTYDDIDKILGKHAQKFKVSEEKYPDGKFKSYTVETISK